MRRLARTVEVPGPTLALRTYRFLRFGAIGVIVMLAASIVVEATDQAPHCLRASISAYYYTPARTIFTGTLLVLGFTMIVLWGKSWREDACFNLAGMLAPVVAFAPTDDTYDCRVGGRVDDVLAANHPGTDNTMAVYLGLLAAALVVLLAIQLVAQTQGEDWLVANGREFWLPWGAAALLTLVGSVAFFRHDRSWFYGNAHALAATVMFVFIVLAVVSIAYDKGRGLPRESEHPEPRWALVYGVLAGAMTLGAILIRLWPGGWAGDWFVVHRVLVLEAWMIGLLAVFWVIQTLDRWDDGVPPRTARERRQAVAHLPLSAVAAPDPAPPSPRRR